MNWSVAWLRTGMQGLRELGTELPGRAPNGISAGVRIGIKVEPPEGDGHLPKELIA